jgi:hypothetical protein
LQTIAVVPVAALAGAQDSESLLILTAEGEMLEIELDH